MRDTVNLPIAIPAWSLVTMLAGALFTAGTLYNQMNMLIDSVKKSDERVSIINERQITNIAAVVNLQQQMQNHEARITSVERSILESAKDNRK